MAWQRKDTVQILCQRKGGACDIALIAHQKCTGEKPAMQDS